jgi:phosphatidate cytidylyltransferase
MAKRVLFGAIFLAISVGMLIWSKTTGVLFMTVCGVFSVFEIKKALQKAGKSPLILPAHVFLLASAAGIICGFRNEIFIYYLPVLPLAVLTYAVFSRQTKPTDALLGMGLCFYPLMPIVFIMYILSSDSIYAPFAFMTAMVATVFGDSFALFTGKLFGKHKLAPRVSPNKTVEGLIGGLIFGTASGVLVYYAMDDLGFHVFDIFTTLLASFAATAAGNIGDLAASVIKREAGIKDYSKLIPGHGGMMDRIDSVIFAIPTVYILSVAFGLM